MFDDSLHKSTSYTNGFEKRQERFIRSLEAKSGHTKKYGFAHSIPLVVSREDHEKFRKFYEAFIGVAKRIALAYNSDKDIQEVMPLPEKARHLLSLCSREYSIGSARPDFLIDQNMNFKINEINARFPFNGFFISDVLERTLFDLDDSESRAKIPDIPGAFERVFGNTLVLKDSESDWDILLYWKYVSERGKHVYQIKPADLTIKNRLFFGDPSLESIVLELKQREILRDLLPSHIESLSSYSHLNDLRTILVIHDKRLLSVFSTQSLFQRYANEEERRLIEPHLIETYAINTESDFQERFCSDKDLWVLKHALKGKGRECFIGSDYSEKEWKEICDIAKRGPYVAQGKIDQKEFTLYFPDSQYHQLHLSGMLLGFDGKFISQGMYRSKIPATQVSKNQNLILPFIIKDN